jgi:hypothetical protein
LTFGLRAAALTLIFAVQVVGMTYARFVPTRYLCWAPYDQISFYRIEALAEDRPLTQTQIQARYRVPAVGRENRSIHNLLSTIAQFEATYGRADAVQVRVTYCVNGGPEHTWTAPD